MCRCGNVQVCKCADVLSTLPELTFLIVNSVLDIFSDFGFNIFEFFLLSILDITYYIC